MAPILSVVTCVFDEQEIVGDLTERVIRSCRGLSVPFEFVVVNDGSRDDTLARLTELSRENPELRVINLFRNFGHMPALSAGIDQARGEAVVVMDGDLQDPPELIPDFMHEWRAGADVVYGLRTRRNETRLKRTAIEVFYWLMGGVSDIGIPKQVGTFGLMDRRVVDILNRMPERHRFFAGLRAWVGGKQAFVPYARPDRQSGSSRVGIRGLFRLAQTALFSFSKVPLRYASLFSLMCGLILLCVGLTAIGIRLLTNLAIPGWATYTTMLGMIGFVQSLALTVLSEYVAVIFDEVKARPLFLVRDEIAGGQPVSRQVSPHNRQRDYSGEIESLSARLNELIELIEGGAKAELQQRTER
jgi:dolichol-phosphate mannosyltransferase